MIITRAESEAEIGQAMALRSRMFRNSGAHDRDRYDQFARHYLIKETATGAVAGCFRLTTWQKGQDAQSLYSSRFYGLGNLCRQAEMIVELGRVCLSENADQTECIRAALAYVAQEANTLNATFLIGCSTFSGTSGEAHASAFGNLARSHICEPMLQPEQTAAETIPLRPLPNTPATGISPLLRVYLMLGAKVADHAVIDRELGTCVLLTILDVARMPSRQKQRLLALASD